MPNPDSRVFRQTVVIRQTQKHLRPDETSKAFDMLNNKNPVHPQIRIVTKAPNRQESPEHNHITLVIEIYPL